MASPTREVTIRIFVDKASNRVAFAEAGGDFVDILLSFLTMPMGTIVRLLNKSSQLHCMDNLYRSVDENLATSLFVSEAAHRALLQPANLADRVLRYLALSPDDTYPFKWYACYVAKQAWCSSPHLLSRFCNDRCPCGSSCILEISSLGDESWENGIFVNGASRFFITDALRVGLSTTTGVLKLLEDLGVGAGDIEEFEVPIRRPELLNLLGRFLISDTALTDVFLDIKNPTSLTLRASESVDPPVELTSIPTESKSTDNKADVKLLVHKENNRVLYAEDNDGAFAEMVLRLLTFPLGAVVRILDGRSSLTCVDNLYRSVKCLSNAKCITSPLRERMLLDPHAEAPPVYHRCPQASNSFAIPRPRKYLTACNCSNPHPHQFQEKDPNLSGRFLTENLLVVSDCLNVETFSAAFCLNYLRVGNGGDTLEKNTAVGQEKVAAILRACLTSKTPLSDVLLK